MDKIPFIISIIFNLLNLDVSIKIQLCLCYDEAHRVTQNTSVAGQLEADMTTMARESRKWNLSIGLYTQSILDYLSRMEGSTGRELTDLYTRMVGAQQ